MTRINLIPVNELTDKHLVAEYREIMRLPNNLKKSLSRSKPFSMDEIPLEYTLGTGHVKFFYNKMLFLEKRFVSLLSEMKNRGFTTNFQNPSIFSSCDPKWYNDYTPTNIDISKNIERINDRISNMRKK